MGIKKTILPLVATAILAGAMFFVGCEKEKKTELMSETMVSNINDVNFKSVVIGTEKCSENIVGYLMDVCYPEGIGDSLRLSGILYSNVVKTYSVPQQSFNIGDTVSGTYQNKPDSLCDRICSAMNPYYDVPEIIVKF